MARPDLLTVMSDGVSSSTSLSESVSYSSSFTGRSVMSPTATRVLYRGIEWSLRAFASMQALRFILRARAMIKFVLRAASTLKIFLLSLQQSLLSKRKVVFYCCNLTEMRSWVRFY